MTTLISDMLENNINKKEVPKGMDGYEVGRSLGLLFPVIIEATLIVYSFYRCIKNKRWVWTVVLLLNIFLALTVLNVGGGMLLPISYLISDYRKSKKSSKR